MEANVNEVDDRVLIRIADKLVQAQQELDELVVQFSLGKVEAKDKFEEIKGDFRDRIHDIKNLISRQRVDGVRNELTKRLDELEEMLKSGVALSAEAFEKQREKIDQAIGQLKQNIGRYRPTTPYLDSFSHDLEKFKLKLEILHLVFTLKRLEVKDSFKENMREIKKRIDHTVSSLKGRINTKKNTLSALRKEAREMYSDLKKAIESI